MHYDEAQRRLRAASWFPADAELSVPEQLDLLKQLADAGELPDDGPAIWYALQERLRYLADYYERDLVRYLKYDCGLTWQQVAEAVDAGLNSRQAAQVRWSRLIKPTRGNVAGAADKATRTRQRSVDS